MESKIDECLPIPVFRSNFLWSSQEQGFPHPGCGEGWKCSVLAILSSQKMLTALQLDHLGFLPVGSRWQPF